MNYVDLIIFITMLACATGGYLRGFVRTVFGFVSLFASIFITYQFYPVAGAFLRTTPLYGFARDKFIEALNLKEIIGGQASAGREGLLESLPIPGVIIEQLKNFNTPEIYELLNVESVEDYVGGFFANIAMHFLAMILVFIIVRMILSLIGGALNAIAGLPLLKGINRVGGLAVGFLIGAVIVFAGISAASLFPAAYAALEESFAARWLLDNNLLLTMISNVR